MKTQKLSYKPMLKITKSACMLVASIAFSLLIVSCDKDDQHPRYTGKVLNVIGDCNSGNGSPLYNIAFDNSGTPDSIATGTLPKEAQLSGTDITFRMRNLQQGDAVEDCTANMIPFPHQVVVYDVSIIYKNDAL